MNKTLIVTVVLMAVLAQLTWGADDSTPRIEFSWAGGHSNIKTAEVQVKDSGKVLVQYEKHGQKLIEYGFELDQDEVSALTSLVEIVNIFDHPANDTSITTDVDQSTLIVSMGDKRRALTYRYRPELDPLTQELWKLINQGIVIVELRTNVDTYQAMVASSPRLAGSKVYCPRLLVEPLKSEIARCKDRQKLEWGLTGLAWIVSEAQWLGFVSSQLADADLEHKTLILSVLGSHPFYDNIPPSHSNILLPLLTSVLDSFSNNKSTIESRTDESLGILCQFMGARKYGRCLPVLLKLQQVHGDSVAGGWAGWAVASINAGGKKPQFNEDTVDSSESQTE